MPILSDHWDGLDAFFRPESEILVAHDTDGAIRCLEAEDAELARIALLARQRTLEEHTADRRAAELESAIGDAATRSPQARHRSQQGAAVAGAG